jgi:hypothetical protein
MKLIRRLSSGLFSPQEIVTYQNDSRWLTTLYLLILVLLMALPSLLTMNKNSSFGYDEKLLLREDFYRDGVQIPFYIKHGQLFHDTGDMEYSYSKTLKNGILVKATIKELSEIEQSTIPTVIFTKNGVIFHYTVYTDVLLSYADYPNLENLDFGDAYDNNEAFWGVVMPIIADKLAEFKPYVMIASIMVAILGTLGSLVIWSLITTVFQKINIGSKVKFTKLWQLMIYVMAPYALGNLLSDLFGLVLLYYIGFILMVVNSAKIGQTIVTGGTKNEL